MSGVGCLGVCLLRKRRDQEEGRAARHPTVKAKLKNRTRALIPIVGFFLGKVSGFFLFHVAANGPHGGHKKAYPYGEHDLGDGRRKHIRMIVHEPEHGGPPLFAGRPLSGLGYTTRHWCRRQGACGKGGLRACPLVRCCPVFRVLSGLNLPVLSGRATPAEVVCFLSKRRVRFLWHHC